MSKKSYISLRNVSVSFPIYQAKSRSFRRALLRSTIGGVLRRGEDSGAIEVNALSGLDLEINAGDRLALIGHNGAGKSTLLKVLAGIYPPSAGHIAIGGSVMTLFDIHGGFDEEATGYESIMLRGLLIGQSRAEIELRVQRIAEFSGLGGFLHLPVRTYSSGMMMRLMFSIATSAESDIVLMDEWLATGRSGLPDERRILACARSPGNPKCSCSPRIRATFCGRSAIALLVLEGGRIVFDGAVDEALAVHAAMQAA